MQLITYSFTHLRLARRHGDVPRHGAQLLHPPGRHLGAGADQRLGHAALVRRVLGIRARGSMGPPRPGLRRPKPALLAHRRVRDEGAGGVLQLSVIDAPSRVDPCTFTNAQGVEQSTFYRLNGHVGTQGRFQYKYGVAAARVRFQEARGQHGAFWMHAPVVESGAEIDVIEWLGTGSSGLGSGVWTYSGGTQTRAAEVRCRTRRRTAPTGPALPRLLGRVDAHRVRLPHRRARDAAHQRGVSQAEEHLILSPLVSNFESCANSPDALPQTMSVDWVRVWQQ